MGGGGIGTLWGGTAVFLQVCCILFGPGHWHSDESLTAVKVIISLSAAFVRLVFQPAVLYAPLYLIPAVFFLTYFMACYRGKISLGGIGNVTRTGPRRRHTRSRRVRGGWGEDIWV